MTVKIIYHFKVNERHALGKGKAMLLKNVCVKAKKGPIQVIKRF